MPEVHFVGEIETVGVDNVDNLSITWGILPGNRAWNLRNGLSSGESQICAAGLNGLANLNHPIDAFFETSSIEGWPFFVCEVLFIFIFIFIFIYFILK